jgi:hypothetical protein
MLRPLLIAVAPAAVLAGCAMNTGVLPLGQAQEYCAAQQKEFVTIATDQPRDTRFEVDFRCLRPGDRDLVHRFQSSNHIRRLDRVCKTTCGRPGPD